MQGWEPAQEPLAVDQCVPGTTSQVSPVTAALEAAFCAGRLLSTTLLGLNLAFVKKP